MWYRDTQSRILDWKNFRDSLDVMTEFDAINATNDFYNTAPISSQYYCADFPEQWPDPWQLIVDNYYDDIAKALGMLYTLYYTKHKILGEIRCYRDNDASKEYNLSWLGDGKYILNYNLQVLVNNKNTFNDNKLGARLSIEDLLNESNSSNKKNRSTRKFKFREAT
jgi:hypothetical protein